MSSNVIWGLKNWLQAINLDKYYNKFKIMNYSQLLSITKSDLSKLCTPEDVDILWCAIEKLKNKLELISQSKALCFKGRDEYFILQVLEFILPSQFEPLLGPVSKQFVGLMKIINSALQKIKSPPMKIKCMRLFCKYCFYGEQSEYFLIKDKDTLQTMRLQHQKKAKPAKKK